MVLYGGLSNLLIQLLKLLSKYEVTDSLKSDIFTNNFTFNNDKKTAFEYYMKFEAFNFKLKVLRESQDNQTVKSHLCLCISKCSDIIHFFEEIMKYND